MPSDDEKPTSIWKKEMSFRRKPAEESAAEGSSESTSAAGSIWKKELSLRKKPQDDAVEPEAVAAEPELDPAVAAALELIAGPSPEPTVPEPAAEPAAAVEHSWLTKPLEEVSEPPEELASVPLLEELPAVDPVAEAPTLVSPVSLVPAELPAAAAEEVAPSVSEQELELELTRSRSRPARGGRRGARARRAA